MNDKATQLLADILALENRQEYTTVINKLFKDYLDLEVEDKNTINDILLDHKEFQRFVDIYIAYDANILQKYTYLLLKYVYEYIIFPLKEKRKLEKFKKSYKTYLKECDNIDIYYSNYPLSEKPKSKDNLRISTRDKAIQNFFKNVLGKFLENTPYVDLSTYKLIIEGVVGYKIIGESTKFITVSTL